MPNGVEVTEAVADPSKVLKKTREMNKVIFHSNLILFFKLSDYYRVAELKVIVEDAMIEKLDEGNYEEFREDWTNYLSTIISMFPHFASQAERELWRFLSCIPG